MANHIKIALNNETVGVLTFQEVISIFEDQIFLSVLSIKLENKLLEKIRFDDFTQPYDTELGMRLTMDFLYKKLSYDKQKTSKKNKRKQEVDRKAALKSAKSLFNDIGINI